MKRLGFVASAVALFLSCQAEPKGQLMIAVTTDMKPGTDFDAVEVEITAGSDRHAQRFDEAGGTLKFPFTMAVVEGTSPSPEIHVRVVTTGLNRNVHELTAVLPSDRIALARVHVDWLCSGVTCETGQSCSGGLCFDWTRDSGALPTFAEPEVFGGRTFAEGDGACFDTVNCFASGQMVDVDLDTCSVARPASDALNVALVPPPGRPTGICGSEACFVPLDANERFGFRIAGTRIHLPFEACTRIRDGRLLGVATTLSCPTKTVKSPTCGPWSSARGGLYTNQAPAPIGYRDASADAPTDANVLPETGP
jgi:hypothetical protein